MVTSVTAARAEDSSTIALLSAKAARLLIARGSPRDSWWMSATGRPSRYPLEFQRDAVAMVLDEKRSIADVARSIGVIEGTLGNWVAKARRERDAGRGATPDERAENVVLRAENAQLRMERGLLKRSLAFWVKESTS